MQSELYSEIILDLYKNPLNKGEIEGAELTAEGGNPLCGDYAKIFLRIKNNVIEDAKFLGNGCAISVASESILTEMLKGKKLSEAKKLTEKELFAELGNIIQTRIKCALLGLIIVKKGFEEFEKNGGKQTEVRGIKI